MSLALYRTYRPGKLDEVVGQEHVTEPLRRALLNNRVHHAYLFSGPRGCGKTSTARILARSLNCEQGPTPDPCGECQSCLDLAPNGPGSIDVVELDAASHRGIDDARELRERAIYAPASSRYKIYIIDEAHQLTTDASNALLKLVEEPPEHLRFIFATTEPDKIIGTIRSRTFHYSFRLVPSRVLIGHLGAICEREGVAADAPALALVARAGAGSVRDALSVLGQMIAAAGPEGVTYADVVVQLGQTDASLLDEVVDAIAASDGRALFRAVDSVVSAGHDPRRFVIDLLDRLRDLLVLQNVPDAVESGLLDLPDDLVVGMREQAALLGRAELSRVADLVSAGLFDIKGATAPRLQLELLCARLVLPEAAGFDGLAARIDRLERRVSSAQVHQAGAPGASASSGGHAPRSAGPVGLSSERASQDAVAHGEVAGAVVGEQAEDGQRRGGQPRAGQQSVAGEAGIDGNGGGSVSDVAPQSKPEGGSAGPTRQTSHAVPAVPVAPVNGGGEVEGTSRTAGDTAGQGSAADRVVRPPGKPGGAPTAPWRQRPQHGGTDQQRAPQSGQEQQRPPQAGQEQQRPPQAGRAQPSSPQGQGSGANPIDPSAAAPPTSVRQPVQSGDRDIAAVRSLWPAVLDALKSNSRTAYSALMSSRPLSLTAEGLAVGVPDAGRIQFARNSGHDERLRQAVIDVVRIDPRVDLVLDPGASGQVPGVAATGWGPQDPPEPPVEEGDEEGRSLQRDDSGFRGRSGAGGGASQSGRGGAASPPADGRASQTGSRGPAQRSVGPTSVPEVPNAAAAQRATSRPEGDRPRGEADGAPGVASGRGHSDPPDMTSGTSLDAVPQDARPHDARPQEAQPQEAQPRDEQPRDARPREEVQDPAGDQEQPAGVDRPARPQPSATDQGSTESAQNAQGAEGPSAEGPSADRPQPTSAESPRAQSPSAVARAKLAESRGPVGSGSTGGRSGGSAAGGSGSMAGRPRAESGTGSRVLADASDEPSADDPDLDASGLSGVDLAIRELGAVRIGEIES